MAARPSAPAKRGLPAALLAARPQLLLEPTKTLEHDQGDRRSDNRERIGLDTHGDADRRHHPNAGRGGQTVDVALGAEDAAGAEKPDAGDRLSPASSVKLPDGASSVASSRVAVPRHRNNSPRLGRIRCTERGMLANALGEIRLVPGHQAPSPLLPGLKGAQAGSQVVPSFVWSQ